MGSYVLLLLLTLAIGILPLSVYLIKTLRLPQKEKDNAALDSDLIREKKFSAPHRWWEDQRGKYNYGLLFSGLLAFSLYFLSYILFYKPVSFIGPPELFSFLFIIVSYLIYMGVANLFYNLGSIGESVLKPQNKQVFRHRFFNIGYWISILLPFFVLLAFWIEQGIFQ